MFVYLAENTAELKDSQRVTEGRATSNCGETLTSEEAMPDPTSSPGLAPFTGCRKQRTPCRSKFGPDRFSWTPARKHFPHSQRIDPKDWIIIHLGQQRTAYHYRGSAPLAMDAAGLV
jgi:hypothetical protein